MTKKYNKKYYHPEIPNITDDDKHNYVMKGSNFIDPDNYKQKCFYGPDQSNLSGVQQSLNIGNIGDGPYMLEYTPPRRWPERGRPIRVPQVVFFATRNNELATVAFDDDFDGSNWEGNINEDHRLWLIFKEVIDKLETLRASKTFGTIIDWCNNSTPMIDTLDHLLAPPVTEDNYLGTDFLYIYAGVPVAHPLIIEPTDFFGRYSTRAIGITPWIEYLGLGEFNGFGGSSFNNIPEDIFSSQIPGTAVDVNWTADGGGFSSSYFLGSQARLAKAKELFRRYESWIYAPRIGGEGTDIGLNAEEDPHHVIPIGNLNMERLSAVLEHTSEACSELGVIFKGVSMTEIISADQLFNHIADHFNFDKTTGKG